MAGSHCLRFRNGRGHVCACAISIMYTAPSLNSPASTPEQSYLCMLNFGHWICNCLWIYVHYYMYGIVLPYQEHSWHILWAGFEYRLTPSLPALIDGGTYIVWYHLWWELGSLGDLRKCLYPCKYSIYYFLVRVCGMAWLLLLYTFMYIYRTLQNFSG